MIKFSKELLNKMNDLSYYISKEDDCRKIYIQSEEREKCICINIDFDFVIFMDNCCIYPKDPTLDEVELCGDIIKELKKEIK